MGCHSSPLATSTGPIHFPKSQDATHILAQEAGKSIFYCVQGMNKDVSLNSLQYCWDQAEMVTKTWLRARLIYEVYEQQMSDYVTWLYYPTIPEKQGSWWQRKATQIQEAKLKSWWHCIWKREVSVVTCKLFYLKYSLALSTEKKTRKNGQLGISEHI